MADQSASQVSSTDRHRKTVFPRSNPGNHPTALKRAFLEQDGPKDTQKLRRMIPVKSQPGFLSTLQAPTTLRKEEMDPWERYQACMKLDQAGPGKAVYAKNSSFEEMVIKEVKNHDKRSLRKVFSANHKNIVKLHEAFYHEGSIYLCYEIMDVSLAQVFGTPLGTLNHYEVAAFCKEVLEGLQYLHTSLRIIHGNLSAKNILLSAGMANIKIANLGTCMLEPGDCKDTQRDIRALGLIMIECLEPITALRNGHDLVHDRWDSTLREFQVLTRERTAAELLQHDFIQRSPGPTCLKWYIRAARESAPKDVEILPDWPGCQVERK